MNGAYGAISRRDLLGGMGGLGLSALLQPMASRAQAGAPAARLIDTHRHLASPLVIETMKAQNVFRSQDAPGVEAMFAEMQRSGVATSILSMMVGPIKLDAAGMRRLARDSNEFMAKLASEHAGQVRFFCMLPLPSIDDTLQEIAYALDTLKADGVSVLTSYGDKWFGDPDWNPVYAELNRRKAFVKTHPHDADCCRANEPGIGPALIEYGTDTTRAIARLIFSGTAARYPDIKFAHSHMGGTFPFLMQRFINLAQGAGASRIPSPDAPAMSVALPHGLEHEVRKMYYDVAQAYSPVTVAAMKQAVPNSQLIFGSDWPYVDADATFAPLRAGGQFTPTELSGIARGNIRAAIAGLPG
jgi:predicted TIM-barrel fold metal-dependent hydrolase